MTRNEQEKAYLAFLVALVTKGIAALTGKIALGLGITAGTLAGVVAEAGLARAVTIVNTTVVIGSFATTAIGCRFALHLKLGYWVRDTAPHPQLAYLRRTTFLEMVVFVVAVLVPLLRIWTTDPFVFAVGFGIVLAGVYFCASSFAEYRENLAEAGIHVPSGWSVLLASVPARRFVGRIARRREDRDDFNDRVLSTPSKNGVSPYTGIIERALLGCGTALIILAVVPASPSPATPQPTPGRVVTETATATVTAYFYSQLPCPTPSLALPSAWPTTATPSATTTPVVPSPAVTTTAPDPAVTVTSPATTTEPTVTETPTTTPSSTDTPLPTTSTTPNAFSALRATTSRR